MRLDSPEQTAALNALYDQLGRYYQCFQPVLRLREQARRDNRIIRRWDTAQPPLARRLASPAVSVSERERLEQLRSPINPRALREQVSADRDRLLQQPVGRSAWELSA